MNTINSPLVLLVSSHRRGRSRTIGYVSINDPRCDDPFCKAAIAEGRCWHACTYSIRAALCPDVHFATASEAESAVRLANGEVQ